MHINKKDINVVILGTTNFNISLSELKDNLNFNLFILKDNYNFEDIENYDALIIHEDSNVYQKSKNLIKKKNILKVLITKSAITQKDIYDDCMSLPIAFSELNKKIVDLFAKKSFLINSSISVKDYILDKNEKKLTKNNMFVIVTEKEIELIELLHNNKKAITKNEILKNVWGYSAKADTHTVETHIYRLRKKVKDKFHDENFLNNDKSGYYV